MLFWRARVAYPLALRHADQQLCSSRPPNLASLTQNILISNTCYAGHFQVKDSLGMVTAAPFSPRLLIASTWFGITQRLRCEVPLFLGNIHEYPWRVRPLTAALSIGRGTNAMQTSTFKCNEEILSISPHQGAMLWKARNGFQTASKTSLIIPELISDIEARIIFKTIEGGHLSSLNPVYRSLRYTWRKHSNYDSVFWMRLA